MIPGAKICAPLRTALPHIESTMISLGRGDRSSSTDGSQQLRTINSGKLGLVSIFVGLLDCCKITEQKIISTGNLQSCVNINLRFAVT